MAISVGTTYYSSLGTVYNKGGNVTTGYEVRLKYILNSSNKVTNKHSVTSTLQMRATSSSYNTYGNVSATKTVQGVSESLSYLDSWTTSWRDMYSRTFELEANSEGKLTTNLTGSFNISSYAWSASNSALKSASVSESVEFPTIPRKSDVTCPSFNAGDSTNIVISKKDSSFTSTIRYVFGDLSETIVTKTKETVVGWTPNADDFYAQFPDAKQKSGTIYCDTYSGSTLIGTSETSFTCYAKESECKPDITLKAIDVRELTKALTGDENVVVKGMSDVQLTSTVTYKKSATAKSYVVSSGDGKKSDSNPAILESVDSGIFTATVTDSREYSSSAVVDKTKENKFIDYVKLAFTNVNIGRPETTSSIVNVELKGNYYNGNFSEDVPNTLKLKFRHKEKGGEWSGGIVIDEITVLSPGDALYSKVEIKYGQENLPDGVTATYDGEIMTVNNINPVTQQSEKVADITVGESCFAWAEIEYGSTNLPEGYSATYDSDNKMHITGPMFVADYVELTPTISGNTFSYSGQLGDTFSYKKQYEFEFYAEDELMYVSASDKPIIVTKGISIVRVGDGYVDIRGDLLQNGKVFSGGDSIPVGTIVDYDGDTVPDGYEEVSDYSTDEIEIGTWIDGKPLYRKVIQFNTLINANEQYSIAHNIANADFIYVSKAYFTLDTGLSVTIPETGVYSGFNEKTYAHVDKTYIYVCSNGGWSKGWTKTIVLEYTKTTD